ncbi:MAG: hypothetical protein HOE48_14620 [Candidatus Latescibacteria bacterium]|jgi:hypothetical protein|nr:hypothetical protein [Candidatus Latescibacterota bacterium]
MSAYKQSKPIPLKPTTLQPRRRLLEIYRKGHRYVGIGTLVFLVMLALSGFLLNHPSLLGAPSERTLSFAVDPLDAQHLYRGTRSGLYTSDDGGLSWYEVPMLFAAERAVDITFAPDNPEHIYVALENLGLIRSTDGGIVWEQVPIGFMPLAEGVRLQRIGIGIRGYLHLWTSGGLISSPDSGTTWASVGTPIQPGNDCYTLIHQIHTGYYFANWFVYFYDIAAWGLIMLSFSGIFIWWRLQFGKRRKQ